MMTKKKETVKPVKEETKVIKKPVKKAPKITAPNRDTSPIIIETIRSTEKVTFRPVFEKREILTPVPTNQGDVRVIVLKDYKGMLNDLYIGDIIDMPERRYKSLSFRGLVKLYDGPKQANKQR